MQSLMRRNNRRQTHPHISKRSAARCHLQDLYSNFHSSVQLQPRLNQPLTSASTTEFNVNIMGLKKCWPDSTDIP